ncbi:hypothetical protein FIU87_02435 [Bacillus sp. THAF10]|uniref:hypothetical protein n=1 Tax=Bacillus sp. THAF10 TaxID=2587848 RepID=UPI0012682FBE|nr:hypothetical protein [Bacillus sp. THAF10]QFT87497.1 hypothetical protein FIU87_02435 [Bacillus sp. THAF10]
MKRKTIGVIVLTLLTITLFFNPLDFYAGYKGEKELKAMSSSILEILDLHNVDIKDIQPMGDNIFLLKTDQENFLVQKERSGGLTEFTIYEQHDTTIGMFDGLKPSLSYRIKGVFSR